jgi:hypothetical protein
VGAVVVGGGTVVVGAAVVGGGGTVVVGAAVVGGGGTVVVGLGFVGGFVVAGVLLAGGVTDAAVPFDWELAAGALATAEANRAANGLKSRLLNGVALAFVDLALASVVDVWKTRKLKNPEAEVGGPPVVGEADAPALDGEAAAAVVAAAVPLVTVPAVVSRTSLLERTATSTGTCFGDDDRVYEPISTAAAATRRNPP